MLLFFVCLFFYHKTGSKQSFYTSKKGVGIYKIMSIYQTLLYLTYTILLFVTKFHTNPKTVENVKKLNNIHWILEKKKSENLNN